jgi:hypothetical protein
MLLEWCWNDAGMVLEWCWNGAGAGMVLEWWWLEVADRDGSDGAGAAYTVEKGEATTERSRVQSEADSRRGRGRLPGGGACPRRRGRPPAGGPYLSQIRLD